ncbi:MAG: hypothetical protein QOE05_327 [Actinomycetota bacterium]|nr:hypothetical protein [Actinomycetota bacterium]
MRSASDALLASVDDNLALFTEDTDDRPPPDGSVAMRALTFTGRRVVVANEGDLGNGNHPASSLFYAAHAVITAVREATPAE